MTPEQKIDAELIAQWAINNRYAKSEKEKISDQEMFNIISNKIIKLFEQAEQDKWIDVKRKIEKEIAALKKMTALPNKLSETDQNFYAGELQGIEYCYDKLFSLPPSPEQK